jgi:hypothetical protein
LDLQELFPFYFLLVKMRLKNLTTSILAINANFASKY